MIWILSEMYYPEEAGAGYFLTKIAEAIALKYRVGVLTVQPTYSARGTRAPANETRNGVYIHRCLATTLNKDVILQRLFNLITITISIFLNALCRIRPNDIVLVNTIPPTLPLAAAMACKLRKARLILRVEDLYPDVFLSTRIVKPNSLFVRICNVVQKQVYESAVCICVLGRKMSKIVQSRNGNDEDHIALITHWADSDEVKPLPRKENVLLDELRLSDKFVVQYSGNMGRLYDLENLAHCAKLLKADENIHFLFIGSGAKEASLRKSIRELQLNNITILPPMPRSQLTQSLNACDLAVIPFVEGISGVSVPSRMYNVMSVGKPIVAAAESGSEISQVLLEENIGWVVEPESPDLLAGAILAASSNPDVLKQMSIRARSAASNKYARSTILRKHQALMDRYCYPNQIPSPGSGLALPVSRS